MNFISETGAIQRNSVAMNFNLFAYGTLRKDEFNNQIIVNHSKYVETCQTTDEFIIFTQDYKIFPFIVRPSMWPEMAEYACKITGDLFNINETALRRCDKLEGHPTWYKRELIKLNTSSGIQEAYVYILTKERFDKMDISDYTIFDGDWKTISAEKSLAQAFSAKDFNDID